MKKIFLSLTIISAFASLVFAGGAGTTVFQVLNMPLTAYDASLADISMLKHQNPASIPYNTYSFGFTQVFNIAQTKYSAAYADVPLTKNSGLAISLLYFDYGNMPRTYSDGSGGYTENGSFGANDKLVSLGYGLKFNKAISAGIAIKYVKQEIDDVSYSGFAGSFNTLWIAGKNTFVGAGINDAGPKIQEYNLPSDGYIGISHSVSDKTSFSAQFDAYYNDDAYDIKLAAETGVEFLMLRFGYDLPLKKQSVFDTNTNSLNNFTFGIGLDFKALSVDYAWLPKGDLGSMHMFSLLIRI